MTDANDDYLAREAKARVNIDKQLVAADWIVQNANKANVSAGQRAPLGWNPAAMASRRLPVVG